MLVLNIAYPEIERIFVENFNIHSQRNVWNEWTI